VVSAFYDRFPFPADPLQDGPPPGYNWRWCHRAAHSHCTGVAPDPAASLRILDAGCGTGVSTDYLAHLNPQASLLAVDISAGTLEVARQRLSRSGVLDRVRLEQRSLLDLAGEGPFDLINSVGVLHHLQDPLAGLRALAPLLAPGGLLHLFLYADAGRWEIQRLQRTLGLLGAACDGEGLRLGRQLLAELPASNRLRQRHEQRWTIDTTADANFADMYLHPQETSYSLSRLWELVEAAQLHFLGFSNPEQWDPARLLQGELLERALALPKAQQWLLVENLDPEISHFEFFLSNRPIEPERWLSDHQLLQARLQRNPCLWGWPGLALLDQELRPLNLSPEQFGLLQALEAEQEPDPSLGQLQLNLDAPSRCATARALWQSGVLLLRPQP
jgi:SAM-dependent methyltransferase